MSGDRNVWMRLYAGSTRSGVYYWWGTLPFPVPAWVAASTPTGATAQWLPIQSIPEIASGAIDPLSPLASSTSVSIVTQTTDAVRSITTPELVTGAPVRRVYGLAGYVSATDTVWDVSVIPGTAPASVGDYLVIETEIVQVVDVATPGQIEVTRAELGTWARPHAAQIDALGTPIIALDRCPVTGQWAEVGYTEDGQDFPVWRGRVRGVTATSQQTTTFGLDSLLAVVRGHRGTVPAATDVEAGTRPAINLRTNVEYQTVSFSAVVGDLPLSQWTHVRLLGESGDWVLLDLTDSPAVSVQEAVGGGWYRVVTYEGETLVLPGDATLGVVVIPIVSPLDPNPTIGARVVAVGSSDGVIRFDGVGHIRYNTSGGGRTSTQNVALAPTLLEEFLLGVLEGLDRVEWAATIADDVPTVVGSLVCGVDGVTPASLSPWINPAWLEWQDGVETLNTPGELGAFILIEPRGQLGEYLADVVIHPMALCLCEDWARLILWSWVDSVRDDAGRNYDTTSGDDRSTDWTWATDRSRPVGVVEVEDPTQDVFVLRSLGTRNRGASLSGGRETRTVSGRVERYVSLDSVLAGSAATYELSSPLGVSDQLANQWTAAADLFAPRLPVLETQLADSRGPWVAAQVRIERPDLPVRTLTTGWVMSVTRSLSSGIARVSMLVPFAGREASSSWGPWGTVGVVGSGSAVYADGAGSSRHTLATVLAANAGVQDLLVITPGLTARCTLSGVTLTTGVVSWTSQVGPDPVLGDYLVLPPRPIVALSPTPYGATYGYVAGATPEDGDARWQ